MNCLLCSTDKYRLRLATARAVPPRKSRSLCYSIKRGVPPIVSPHRRASTTYTFKHIMYIYVHFEVGGSEWECKRARKRVDSSKERLNHTDSAFNWSSLFHFYSRHTHTHTWIFIYTCRWIDGWIYRDIDVDIYVCIYIFFFFFKHAFSSFLLSLYKCMFFFFFLLFLTLLFFFKLWGVIRDLSSFI